MIRGGAEVVGYPFQQGQIIVVVIAGRGGADKQGNLRHRLQLRHRRPHPVQARGTVDSAIKIAPQ